MKTMKFKDVVNTIIETWMKLGLVYVQRLGEFLRLHVQNVVHTFAQLKVKA